MRALHLQLARPTHARQDALAPYLSRDGRENDYKRGPRRDSDGDRWSPAAEGDSWYSGSGPSKPAGASEGDWGRERRQPRWQREGEEEEGGFRRPRWQREGEEEEGGFRQPRWQREGEEEEGGFRQPRWQRDGEEEEGGFRRPRWQREGEEEGTRMSYRDRTRPSQPDTSAFGSRRGSPDSGDAPARRPFGEEREPRRRDRERERPASDWLVEEGTAGGADPFQDVLDLEATWSDPEPESTPELAPGPREGQRAQSLSDRVGQSLRSGAATGADGKGGSSGSLFDDMVGLGPEDDDEVEERRRPGDGAVRTLTDKRRVRTVYDPRSDRLSPRARDQDRDWDRPRAPSRRDREAGPESGAGPSSSPPESSFADGERIKAVSGPYKGFIGVVKEATGGRVRAVLDIFGRPTQVHLEGGQVEKM